MSDLEIIWITLPFEDLKYKRVSKEEREREGRRRNPTPAQKMAARWYSECYPVEKYLPRNLHGRYRDKPELLTPNERRQVVIAYLKVAMKRYAAEQRRCAQPPTKNSERGNFLAA